MTQYTIMIDEAQRELILRCLNKAPREDTDHDALIDLFDSLPHYEAERPSIVHGFCL